MRDMRIMLFACAVLVAAPAWAQPLEIDPNAPVSNDGAPVVTLPYSEDTFEHRAFKGQAGPAVPLNFQETGAILDGAEEVYEAEEDMASLPSPVRSLGGGSVIGSDSRVRVNPTTTFPARAIAMITSSGGACTGWFYGPDIVATAGHCVHEGGLFGDWYSNVRVYPGRNGSSSPYGYCRARKLYSVHGWTTFDDEDYDYGAIKLDCTVGNTTGWFGFSWQSASLKGLQATVAGYPADKTRYPATQWRSTGSIAVSEGTQIFYLHDTYNGQSGGPVYQTNRPSCGNCVIGIHNMGAHGLFSPHKNHNHAVRITEGVFNNLLSWKNGS